MLEHKDYSIEPEQGQKKTESTSGPQIPGASAGCHRSSGNHCAGSKVSQEAGSGKAAGPAPTGQVGNATPAQADPAGVSPEEEAAQKEAQEIDNVISSYSNLGIVQVSGLPQHKGDSKH